MADEDIRITADTSQAQQELSKLGEAGKQADTELEGLTTSSDAAADSLGKASESSDRFGKSTEQSGINVQSLTKRVGGLVSVIAILRSNYQALEPEIKRSAEELERLAKEVTGNSEEIETLISNLTGLINPFKFVEQAIENTERAFDRYAERVVGLSDIQANVTDTMSAMLAKLAAARQKAADDVEAAADQEKKAQDEAAKSSERLAVAAAKAAEERAKAEERAVEAEIAALAKRQAAIEASILDAEKRLADALAKGQKLDTSEDTSGLQSELDETQKQIDALENSPIITPEQQQNLDDAKNKALDLKRAIEGLNQAFTISGENYLNEAESIEAAAAAQDLYAALLGKSQQRHDDIMNALEREQDLLERGAESLDDAGSAAEDYGEAAEGAAEGVDALTDSNKALEDGAPEQPLEQMKANAEETNKALHEMVGLLQEIKTLASQVAL